MVRIRHGTHSDLSLSERLSAGWEVVRAQDDPDFAALTQRPRGRPKGSFSGGGDVALGCAVAYNAGFAPAEILHALGRPVNEGPAPFRWVKRCLRRAWLYVGEPSPAELKAAREQPLRLSRDARVRLLRTFLGPGKNPLDTTVR